MTKFHVLAAGVLLASSAFPQDGAKEATWFADFDTAAAAAREAGKDLLVDFTGSDWCGWCIRLHDEVFKHEPFLAGVEGKYLLVALDFPSGDEAKAKVPNPARNEELSKKYGIEGYPTILLMTADGEVFGRTGYQRGGPEKYIEHLDSIATAGKKALSSAKALDAKFAEAKEPAARKAVVLEALGLLEESESGAIGVDVFERIARVALELDPENAEGLKLRTVKALMKAGRVDAEITAAAKALDPKNENGLIEQLVLAQVQSVSSVEGVLEALKAIDELAALGIQDKEVAMQLYLPAAFWNQRFAEDQEKAKSYAKKALELGVENPQAKAALEELIGG